MNIDDNTKRFVIHRLKWLALFVSAGIVMVFVLPFPLDFLSITCLFFLTAYLRTRSEANRFGGSGRIDLFGLLSSSDNSNKLVKYYCIGCGKEHREISCPRCGSKMKKIG